MNQFTNMNQFTKWTRCARRAELEGEIESGHWPEAATPELQLHVKTCSTCGDTVLLAESFCMARAASLSQPALPPAGLLWWRAQLRRRNAALAQVQRPLVGAQIFALLVTMAIAGGMAIVSLRSASSGETSISGWFAGFSKSSSAQMEGLLSSATSALSGNLLLLSSALAVLAVAGGVAALLVTDKS
jgi:predicted anti-sigma-YlaC factor YlaD